MSPGRHFGFKTSVCWGNSGLVQFMLEASGIGLLLEQKLGQKSVRLIKLPTIARISTTNIKYGSIADI